MHCSCTSQSSAVKSSKPSFNDEAAAKPSTCRSGSSGSGGEVVPSGGPSSSSRMSRCARRAHRTGLVGGADESFDRRGEREGAVEGGDHVEGLQRLRVLVARVAHVHAVGEQLGAAAEEPELHGPAAHRRAVGIGDHAVEGDVREAGEAGRSGGLAQARGHAHGRHERDFHPARTRVHGARSKRRRAGLSTG